jgi:hypothetical protein
VFQLLVLKETKGISSKAAISLYLKHILKEKLKSMPIKQEVVVEKKVPKHEDNEWDILNT